MKKSNISAFRSTEKLFKNKKKSKEDLRPHFIDLQNISEDHKHLIIYRDDGTFGIHGIDGLQILPAVLNEREQIDLAKESLYHFVSIENKSNLDPLYPPEPTKNLFARSICTESTISSSKLTPQYLMKKLRWVTLGYHYDWTNRKYEPDDYTEFPHSLGKLSERLAGIAGYTEFTGEAAIINFYTLSSCLCGHLDDAEFDFSKPIVSISLGCSGIFLIGGRTRDVTPIAILMHSGDAAIMGGESRQCYHGVPRVFPCPNTTINTCINSSSILSSPSSSSIPPFPYEHLDDHVALYLKTHRININIRQVGTWPHK